MKKNIIKSLLAIAFLLCSIGVYAHDFKANVLCNDLVNRMQTSRKERAQSNLPKTSQFLPGIYTAYAESAFSGYPDEEWRVSITQDAYDADKVWIQPIIAPFSGLDADEISPVYAYVDEANSTLTLPLGQTLYGGPHEYYNIVVASLDNNSQPVISGEIVVPYYISDDNLTFTIDFLGAGDLNDEAGWWYQALFGIKFSSWPDNAIDGFYYTITSEDECTVAVTYAGEDYRSFKNEYSGSIVIPEKVIINEKSYSVTSIGEFAFADCTGLTEVTIPNSVTSIGSGAFTYCTGLTSIVIPNSVTSIGEQAFWRCDSLTEVIIGNSVTEIGELAFSACDGLTSIVVKDGNTVYDSRENCNAIIETATNTLIAGCKNTIIPNSVTEIGELAFYACTSLTSITLPNSVTSIGSGAFVYCYDLTEVTIPNSVTSIGESAFYYCTGLTEITIPNSVTSIGNDAFNGCTGLTEVTIPNSVTSIGVGAFSDCTGLTSIVVDKDNQAYDSRDNCNAIIETATNTLIVGCMNTVIPNSVTSIGESAFSHCSGLTEIFIPNSVTSIGDYAFVGCTGLTEITIGNSVTLIGEYAFGYCEGLTEVTIGNSVTSIGNGAFAYCEGLTEVTIGNSVTSIGNGAFAYCYGLTEITIPNSVTSIGEWAFADCTGLTEMRIEAVNPPAIYDNTFEGVDKSIPLYVPAESVEAYRTADYWEYFINISEDLSNSAVEDITCDNNDVDVEYYDLNGFRIENPTHGIYIVKQGNTVKKVVL